MQVVCWAREKLEHLWVKKSSSRNPEGSGQTDSLTKLSELKQEKEIMTTAWHVVLKPEENIQGGWRGK